MIMNTFDVLTLAWPWIGGGIGIVVTILLFTDYFRSDLNTSRWFDPVWLSWFMVAAYLWHVVEEYGLHIADSQFQLVTSFHERGIDAQFGGLPMAFFPMVNILFTWVGLPLAAVISRKNPVVGLGATGFLLVNGLTHLMPSIAGIMPWSSNYGLFTGAFVFIPLFCWITYACASRHLLPKGGLTIIIVSGILTHLLLFSIYILNKLAGHTAAFIWIPFVATATIWLSWLLCKAFKVGKQ
jgi:hypothetical protein